MSNASGIPLLKQQYVEENRKCKIIQGRWVMKIEEKQLDEIESLLAYSMNGLHFLFESETIKRILKIPTEETDFFDFHNMTRVQTLFTRLIEHETIEDKREFLGTLDAESYEMLLRAYFHIVDNTLMSHSEFKH